MKTWYNIKVIPQANATSEAEVSIFDEIGFWGINATDFKKDWDKVKNLKNIKITINSPGGSVFDGMAIYNMISDVREKVTVEVDGLAASISSIIAMAGKKLVMREGTFLMIHNPWTMMAGGSDDLRKEADVLDKIKDQLVGIYQNKTNLKASDIEAMMKEETWMTPTEARAMGFADEVVTASRIAASYNKGLIEYGFKHTPISETPNATITEPQDIKEISATVEEPIKVDYTEQTNALRAKILKFKINKINGDDTEVN